MGRISRKNCAGFYHLVNRGVGLREVFLCRDDNIYFIELICNYAMKHDYTIHGYALISNGYNLLIETQKNNLSNIMKVINARYTSYFNRKYGRRGHLWEGRFKSWYIKDTSLVMDILAYIEHLPMHTGNVKTKESSFYSTYRQFIGIDQRLPCLHGSIVFQLFNNVAEIKKFFNKPIDIAHINNLHEQLRKNKIEDKNTQKTLVSLPKDYFSFLSLDERNKKIYKTYYEGYSQAKIGKNLGISQQAVYKIIQKMSHS